MVGQPRFSMSFKCSHNKGWELDQKPNEVTERAPKFLDVLVEFAKRNSPVECPIGIVQQVRMLNHNGCRILASLLSFQEIPHDLLSGGPKRPRLLAPAVYVEVDADPERIVKEARWIARYLGKMASPVLSSNMVEALTAESWCYDAVFWLHDLTVDYSSRSKAGKLRVRFELVGPQDIKEKGEALTIPRIHNDLPLWRADTDLPNQTSTSPKTASCFCLPWLSPAKRYTDDDSCVVYVAGSRASRKTLEEISSIWLNRSVRNVLLAAPPGGGKEVVARLIHVGRAQGEYKPISAAGQSWEEFRIPLLGQGLPAGPTLFRGLIEEAQRGTVFVDEIDKAKPEIRSALLRIIEADEFYRPGSGSQVKLPRENRPLYIFAGSGEGDAVRKKDRVQKSKAKARKFKKGLTIRERIEREPPPDFWQRIDWHVNLGHPLGTQGDWWPKVSPIVNNAVHRFVSVFMRQARDKHYSMGGRSDSPYPIDKVLNLSADVVARRLDGKWSDAVTAMVNMILTHRPARRSDPEHFKPPSVRDLRSKANEWITRLCNLAKITDLPSERDEIKEQCQQVFGMQESRDRYTNKDAVHIIGSKPKGRG